ncbi:DUF421 domain-containing protein [Indiicoccus explosivorum]|uniref:DUF421 domain-containing protein n=1 Tax=Indiicoccus explosivorum TaxID=1917864 RepID=UPI000B445E3C|nr:YetF domain-containing protein [Indiicoccus explosivorum]
MFEITMQSFKQIILGGILAYIALVILLRISKKRTLSKLNMFDFIITIAFGSAISSVILNTSISLIEGILGFAILVFAQFAVTFLSYRSDKFTNLVKANPKLLYSEGTYYREAMKSERVLEVEILQAIRKQGIGTMSEVKAVVLETDGSLSIIKKQAGDALSNVEKPSD